MLTEFGLADTSSVVPKNADRTALLEQSDNAAGKDDEPYDLVVTGDAETVHTLRRGSRSWPRKPFTIKGKAYWAQGRTGLD